jgi:predicted ATPase
MIRLIEALNYRCLRYISQRLGGFHVLVGPNASGKSTFLDAIAFLGDMVSKGLEAAVDARTQDFRDLTWGRKGGDFELAVELEIPRSRRRLLPQGSACEVIRYELSLGLDRDTQEVSILAEKVLLKPRPAPDENPLQKTLFPEEPRAPKTLMSPKSGKGTKTIVNKIPGGNDNFYDETGKDWELAFKLGPRKSALANLPEDESKFPVATWLKSALMTGVQRLVLSSALMRQPSPPGQPKTFRPDGSNLPWVVEALSKGSPDRLEEWIAHLRTSLPDLKAITTVERPEDRKRYLVVCYANGLQVPSWMVSDGTLRLLALTLPAYLPELEGVLLIEEPENGIHPCAVETMLQSLSSTYGAQVLLATHSPVILGIADVSQVLCFSRTEEGATDIVAGSDHPALRDWRGEANLGVLFAGGVLG